MLTAKFPQGLAKQHFRRNHLIETLPRDAACLLFGNRYFRLILKEAILTKV